MTTITHEILTDAVIQRQYRRKTHECPNYPVADHRADCTIGTINRDRHLNPKHTQKSIRMRDPKPWQSFVAVAILHPVEARILVQQSGTALALPSLPLAKVWAEPLARINEEVQSVLGIATTVLHKLAEARDEAQHRGSV